MATTLEQHLKDIEPLQALDPETMYSVMFFRDPNRPSYTDVDFFFAPADGVIMDQKVVEPDEEIVEVKGIEYTTQKLLDDKTFDKRALVISTFMHQFSVHVNRMPTNGCIWYKNVEPMQTHNIPMLLEEHDLLKGVLDYSHMNYPTRNGRTVNTVINGRYTYYIVQICDSDVNVVCPFTTSQGSHFFQNDRFGSIRYGSQVSLIMPIVPDFTFKTLLEPSMCVQAGLDRLVYIKSNPGYMIGRR